MNDEECKEASIREVRLWSVVRELDKRGVDLCEGVGLMCTVCH